MIDGGAHDAGEVGDAAATGADGDGIAGLHGRHDAALFQGFADGGVDVIDLGRVEVLVDGQECVGQVGGETDVLDVLKQVHCFHSFNKVLPARQKDVFCIFSSVFFFVQPVGFDFFEPA